MVDWDTDTVGLGGWMDTADFAGGRGRQGWLMLMPMGSLF